VADQNIQPTSHTSGNRLKDHLEARRKMTVPKGEKKNIVIIGRIPSAFYTEMN